MRLIIIASFYNLIQMIITHLSCVHQELCQITNFDYKEHVKNVIIIHFYYILNRANYNNVQKLFINI